MEPTTEENGSQVFLADNDFLLPVDDTIIDESNTDGILEDHLEIARVRRFEIDTNLRKHLAYVFTAIIFLWLMAALCILFCNQVLLCLNLSDTVLITLLTTTSVNVIGMMIIILKNLFPQYTS
ncbi:hypothetical protein SAMN05660909_04709 [Chitinophaga terrae (ex Kim and Jung 2007)]|jgi:hypothetical protein|uniref:Uncharacterized protein n=1 Tax=Chitinophaga terrae (ex Kim and Jung 2007) TaxID=408074 RepID=A0A1H4FXD4_9BACT|nr:hypothetical protein SAMN05660909_04709 [Chitinophaga terrae (ex Kim and Jung 2007)]